MTYEYLIAVGVIGLLYLIVDKLNSLLSALKAIEQSCSIARLEIEGLAKRLMDIEDTLGSSQSHLARLESVASEYRNVHLRTPDFDPYAD